MQVQQNRRGGRIRVLIVDAERYVVEGICRILEAEPELEVVGRAHDGAEAVRLAAERTPDVILMNLTLPVRDGVDAAQNILTIHCAAKVIFLSGLAGSAASREALLAGAAGIVTKDVEADALISAIRTVYAGGNVFPFDVLRRRVGMTQDLLEYLSPRELQVLRLMAERLKVETVAQVLKIEGVTVRTHLSNAMRKLGFANRTEAIVWYRERHLYRGP